MMPCWLNQYGFKIDRLTEIKDLIYTMLRTQSWLPNLESLYIHVRQRHKKQVRTTPSNLHQAIFLSHCLPMDTEVRQTN